MNKKVFGRKLSRSRPARSALFASLARAFILNGKMVTSRAKAKAIQGMLEKFVSVAKTDSLAGKQRILSDLDNAGDALDFLYKKVAPAFSGRNSGFVRVVALSPRKGDNAQMVRLEWTEKISEEVKAKKEKVKK